MKEPCLPAPIRPSDGRLMPPLFVRLALAGFLAGCSGETDGADPFTVRDSAGIRIAESTAPAWSDGEGWVVADTPWLDIGMADGEAAFLFSRVVGIARPESGEIIVANGGSGEIRVFDGEGRHIRTFGAIGEGPGEFRQLLDLIGRSGDTLFLNDNHVEIEAFGIDGAHRGTTRFEPLPASIVASPIGRFADGSFLRGTSPQGNPPRSGVQRWTDSTTFLLHGVTGAFLGEVVRRPMIVFSLDNEAPGVIPDYLGPVGSVTASREHVYFSFPDDWNIEVRKPDGTLVGFIRRPFPTTTITPEYEQAARDIFRQQLGRNSHGMSHQQMEWLIGRMRFAPEITAHTRMLIDAEGALWVNESDPQAILAREAPLTGAGDWWSVFSTEGEWLGRVRMPADFIVLSIMKDDVAGVARDDLDVEHVRLHRLHREARE